MISSINFRKNVFTYRFALFLVFTTFLISIILYNTGVGADERAMIVEISGKGLIKQPDTSKFEPMKIKMIVSDHSIIKTESESHIKLVYKGVEIHLDENTQMEIRSLLNPKEDVQLKLDTGFAWMKYTGDREFHISTPTAVASVRGTKFAMAHDKNGSLGCVCKGEIIVTPAGKGDDEVEVEKGHSTSIQKDGSILEKDLNEYFDDEKVDPSFEKEIKKEKKYESCLMCHEMTGETETRKPRKKHYRK